VIGRPRDVVTQRLHELIERGYVEHHGNRSSALIQSMLQKDQKNSAPISRPRLHFTRARRPELPFLAQTRLKTSGTGCSEISVNRTPVSEMSMTVQARLAKPPSNLIQPGIPTDCRPDLRNSRILRPARRGSILPKAMREFNTST